MIAVTSRSAFDHAAAGDHGGKHFPPCLVALRGRSWVAMVKPYKDGRSGLARGRLSQKPQNPQNPPSSALDGYSNGMIRSSCPSIWSSTSCHYPMKSIDAGRLILALTSRHSDVELVPAGLLSPVTPKASARTPP